MGARVDYVLVEGQPRTITAEYRDNAGNPVDLTAYTAAMDVRPGRGSALRLLRLHSGPGGGITIQAAQGRVIASLSGANTTALATATVTRTDADVADPTPIRHADYDLALINSLGERISLVAGTFTMRRATTAAT